jgi:integrase
LRSTYGTALYRETGDIRLVADVLGHENINTTIDYYAAMEDEHKKQAANAVNYRKE